MRLISTRRAKYLRKRGKLVFWSKDWYSYVYIKDAPQ